MGATLSQGLCFLCGMPGGRWTVTKKGLPTFMCDFCRTRMFINTQAGVDAVSLWVQKLPIYREELAAKMLERTKNIVASPVPAITSKEDSHGVGDLKKSGTPSESSA